MAACMLRNGGDPTTNPICSPINAPNMLLNQLPRIAFTACEVDVLRDQAIDLLDRILAADCGRTENRARLIFFKDYVHGFNNFDLKIKGVSEYHFATLITIKLFEQMFSFVDSDKKANQFVNQLPQQLQNSFAELRGKNEL